MGRGDRFQEKTFSNAVSNGKITQEEWEIAMGERCPNCKNLYGLGDCFCDDSPED
jgi:hypothetical protein